MGGRNKQRRGRCGSNMIIGQKEDGGVQKCGGGRLILSVGEGGGWVTFP